ncbi:hypothetical protein VP018_002477 [Morganella morganii]|uniref:hypothetical protein n=1 Tax=Morganella morganii TaxID=582 RepID=UPI00052E16BD|nr:hypothetical protein [Morganella morganii]EMD0830626.1 hypothetical protein [Morganella morganii]KGP41903.1 hypothetical protein LR61_20685 [Morganella morganii]MQC09069.1 hypothetical protein [Morganella morganii]MQC12087.1 hypothetical protein [Morganella morganii]MQC16407.1 hypothetical protein [Morganella morganii]
MDNETVGILWFKNKNQYLSYLHALTDANELPRSYTAWLSQTSLFISQAERQGLQVMKIHAEVLEVYSWCHKNKINFDTDACRRFAMLRARKKCR